MKKGNNEPIEKRQNDPADNKRPDVVKETVNSKYEIPPGCYRATISRAYVARKNKPWGMGRYKVQFRISEMEDKVAIMSFSDPRELTYALRRLIPEDQMGEALDVNDLRVLLSVMRLVGDERLRMAAFQLGYSENDLHYLRDEPEMASVNPEELLDAVIPFVPEQQLKQAIERHAYLRFDALKGIETDIEVSRVVNGKGYPLTLVTRVGPRGSMVSPEIADPVVNAAEHGDAAKEAA